MYKHLIKDTIDKNLCQGNFSEYKSAYVFDAKKTVEENLLTHCCELLYFRWSNQKSLFTEAKDLATMVENSIRYYLNFSNHKYVFREGYGSRQDNEIRNTSFGYLSVGRNYFIDYDHKNIYNFQRKIALYDNNMIFKLMCLLLKDNFFIDQDLLLQYKESLCMN